MLYGNFMRLIEEDRYSGLVYVYPAQLLSRGSSIAG